MPGMRNLSPEEVAAMLPHAKCRRDRLLILIPCDTGFRCKEVLSLKVSDVYQHGAVVDEITVMRRNLKNGRGAKRRRIRSRTVPVLPELRAELMLFIAELEAAGELHPNRRLFATRESGPWDSMIYCRAQQIWKTMAAAAGVRHRINTHSGRKTFSREFYEASGHDLVLTQKAMGHAHISTTIAYLESTGEAVADVMRKMRAAGGPLKAPASAAEAPKPPVSQAGDSLAS